MTFPYYKPLQLLLEKAGERGLIAMLFVCSLAIMTSASIWWIHHLSDRLESLEDHQRTILLEILKDTNETLADNTAVLGDVKTLLLIREWDSGDALWYNLNGGQIYVVRVHGVNGFYSDVVFRLEKQESENSFCFRHGQIATVGL